ncbi:hypothetical protein ABGB18_25345 [Nonomuraea sp. B12E4]|uniref:hypothetical protein n=1 Tax=Nonomuraea sp. B12E4 TaxID=3153564 RepID=UPI00325C3D49
MRKRQGVAGAAFIDAGLAGWADAKNDLDTAAALPDVHAVAALDQRPGDLAGGPALPVEVALLDLQQEGGPILLDPLSEVPAAIEYVERGHARAKVVITV